jgi:hypothetical protein
VAKNELNLEQPNSVVPWPYIRGANDCWCTNIPEMAKEALMEYLKYARIVDVASGSGNNGYKVRGSVV